MGHLHLIKKIQVFVYLFIFSLLLVNCNTVKNKNTSVNYEGKYTVYNIDSINNYYLVYLKSMVNNKKYKIVSKKEFSTKCEIIKIGNEYKYFNLERVIKPENYIPKNISTSSPLEFVPDCVKFNESTEICRERGMDNIYTSKNLIGLCYINIKYSESSLPNGSDMR